MAAPVLARYVPAESVREYQQRPDPTEEERCRAAGADAYGAESWWLHEFHVQRFVCKAGRVLELGAGVGAHTHSHTGANNHVTVVDISPTQISRHQSEMRRLGIDSQIAEWVVADMLGLPFGDQEFDAVTCLGGVLSHLVEKGLAGLAEIARVLKPGGTAVISAAPVDWIDEGPSVGGVFRGGNGCGFRAYDGASLAWVMRRVGITPIHFSAASLGPKARKAFFGPLVEKMTGVPVDEQTPLVFGPDGPYVSPAKIAEDRLALLRNPALRARYIAACQKKANVDKSPAFLIAVGKVLA